MAKNMQTETQWPHALQYGDNLYAVENLDTGMVEYLVYSSAARKKTYIRDNGIWWRVDPRTLEDFDDPKYSLEFVDIDYIDEYDRLELKDTSEKIQVVLPKTSEPAESGESAESAENVIAAAPPDVSQCPQSTSDFSLNEKNLNRATARAGYGPNDKESFASFWANKAELWNVRKDEVRTRVCSSCRFFTATPEMKTCISKGMSAAAKVSESSRHAGDLEELGYCGAFDFVAAGHMSCDAWMYSEVAAPQARETEKSVE